MSLRSAGLQFAVAMACSSAESAPAGLSRGAPNARGRLRTPPRTGLFQTGTWGFPTSRAAADFAATFPHHQWEHRLGIDRQPSSGRRDRLMRVTTASHARSSSLGYARSKQCIAPAREKLHRL